MKQNDFIQQLFETLEPTLNTLSPTVSDELKNSLRSSLRAGLQHFDFVSYDELRVQKKVLQKTREKVEALEKQLDELLKHP